MRSDYPMIFVNAKKLRFFFFHSGDKCLDNDIGCESLKKRGYCESEEYKNYMEFNCKRTCNLCRRRIGESQSMVIMERKKCIN